ncbi:hypothetical protein [Halalkalibacter akibai]|uniref:DUF4181 domain-containing protein n=1 Tax=Halalkalibacter akibai (strain ATCC 43226 / DSM 21942 / CIP 109018 / JCM 9157 / 1139) TaxID=1236973 RepID=W4QQF9_HALA3|nr:hypothetical protein [Halalkalibacter akibai]GAE33569.1 hypothetical protein JCM9157_581 [Halalkalibacter akibai JCM 9157]
MYQNRGLMILFIIFWVIVLRLYIFEEERSIIHFLLGSTIFGVLLNRYKHLSSKHKKTQANAALIIAIIIFLTLIFWYVVPFFA